MNKWNFIWDTPPKDGQYIIYLFPVFNKVFFGKYTKLTPTDENPWEHMIVNLNSLGFLQDEDVYWIPMPGFADEEYYKSIEDLCSHIAKQKEENRKGNIAFLEAREKKDNLLKKYIEKYGELSLESGE